MFICMYISTRVSCVVPWRCGGTLPELVGLFFMANLRCVSTRWYVAAGWSCFLSNTLSFTYIYIYIPPTPHTHHTRVIIYIIFIIYTHYIIYSIITPRWYPPVGLSWLIYITWISREYEDNIWVNITWARWIFCISREHDEYFVTFCGLYPIMIMCLRTSWSIVVWVSPNGSNVPIGVGSEETAKLAYHGCNLTYVLFPSKHQYIYIYIYIEREMYIPVQQSSDVWGRYLIASESGPYRPRTRIRVPHNLHPWSSRIYVSPHIIYIYIHIYI